MTTPVRRTLPSLDSIRMVALDLDGTTLSPDHVTVGVRATEALAELIRRGVLVVPASGRPESLITPLLPQLGDPRYIVSANGARVSDRRAGRADLIDRPRISAEAAELLLRTADRDELSCELSRDGIGYSLLRGAAYALDEFPSGFQRFLRENSTIVPDFSELISDGDIEKFGLLRLSPEQQRRLSAEVAEIPGVEVTSSTPTNVEVGAVGVSKASALAALADLAGVDAGQVLVFGDSNNDVEMLGWAGHSVAMGNASQAAKAAADWVGPSNAEDGVGRVLTGLLEEEDAICDSLL